MRKGKGMKIERLFTKKDEDPFSTAEYERRSSIIRNPDGSIVFEMNDVLIPKSWSQVATDILAQKYFRKAGIPQYDENGKEILLYGLSIMEDLRSYSTVLKGSSSFFVNNLSIFIPFPFFMIPSFFIQQFLLRQQEYGHVLFHYSARQGKQQLEHLVHYI